MSQEWANFFQDLEIQQAGERQSTYRSIISELNTTYDKAHYNGHRYRISRAYTNNAGSTSPGEAEVTRIFPRQTDILAPFRYAVAPEKLKVVIVWSEPENWGISTGIPWIYNAETHPPRIGMPYADISYVVLDQYVANVTGMRRPAPDIYSIDFSGETSPLSWMEQGVLLLYGTWTSEEGIVGSHDMIWEGYIGNFLRNIYDMNPEIVFLLMGRKTFDRYEVYLPRDADLLTCVNPQFGSGDFRSQVAKLTSENPFGKINDILSIKSNLRIQW